MKRGQGIALNRKARKKNVVKKGIKSITEIAKKEISGGGKRGGKSSNSEGERLAPKKVKQNGGVEKGLSTIIGKGGGAQIRKKCQQLFQKGRINGKGGSY